MYDVLVLAHAHDTLTPNSRYTINLMAKLMVEAGIHVGFQIGIGERPDARVVLNHVDLTVTPDDYREFLRSYPAAINLRLTDISKELVCRGSLVRRGDGYQGPVIVKTKLNYGGIPEYNKNLLGSHGNENEYTWRTTPILHPEEYPIFATPAELTDDLWNNRNFVVQQVATEQDPISKLYCLRSWYVFGDQGFHVLTMSHSSVVRGSNIVERKVIEMEAAPKLETMRRDLGVDYGRFDYVMVDGDAMIFDVNRTPTSTPGAVERYQPQWREMAAGIQQYLG